MDNVVVRKLRVADADDIGRIFAAITRTPARADFVRMIEEQARKGEDASFVAECRGKVVGFMISYMISGGFGIEKSAWIPQLGVNPDFMGKGIGKMLGEHVFGHHKAKGIENVYTSVRWYDADVLSFFKTLGFDRSEFINLRKGVD